MLGLARTKQVWTVLLLQTYLDNPCHLYRLLLWARDILEDDSSSKVYPVAAHATLVVDKGI